MKKLISLLVLVLCLNAKSQTYVAIPDSNFVHYLKTIVPTAFKGDSLNTSSTLVTTTTDSIIVNGYSIANLFGVQYFTSLTYLNCQGNHLTTISSLPNSLQKLICGGNSFASLPTLSNSLTQLKCENNISLTSLPILPNTLTYLFCEGCPLTNLPPLPNSLDTIDCHDNTLVSLPTLPNSLIYLSCAGNSLHTLRFAKH